MIAARFRLRGNRYAAVDAGRTRNASWVYRAVAAPIEVGLQLLTDDEVNVFHAGKAREPYLEEFLKRRRRHGTKNT